jgi:hypothetical protein
LSTTHDPGNYESALLVFLLCTGVKFQKVTRLQGPLLQDWVFRLGNRIKFQKMPKMRI